MRWSIPAASCISWKTLIWRSLWEIGFNYVHSWGSDWQANWGSVGRDREKHEGILILDQQRPGFTSDMPRMSRNLWGKRGNIKLLLRTWGPAGMWISSVKSMCSHQWVSWSPQAAEDCNCLSPHIIQGRSLQGPKRGDPRRAHTLFLSPKPLLSSLPLTHSPPYSPFNPPVCAPLTLA